MAIIRNNHVFKGHKTLLGAKYVTYGEVELPLRDKLLSLSNAFDWGHNGAGSQQLSFSMLCQLTDQEFAKKYALAFTSDIVSKFNGRDWIITASEVLKWIETNSDYKEIQKKQSSANIVAVRKERTSKEPKQKANIVKDICKELSITQKELAAILEVPEGTVSSWAVKNEIPRLGKKAIEFYIQSQESRKIIESYKSFVKLLDVS